MSAPRRHWFLTHLVSSALLCASVAAPASAVDKPWYSALDREARESLERGMGFVRKFREPGECKETVDELAGSVTSLSPEVLGAVVGLALGAAAGAASTASVMGAVRGGILLGSIGSALGHLADVLLPDRVATLADDVQDLIQTRDGKLCELIKASDKLRTPVIEHLQASLGDECKLDAASGAALQHCLRDNPKAAEILERHASVLTAINQGTCRVAASLVRRFERGIAHKSDAADAPSLAPICDEAAPVEPDAPKTRPLAKNVL